MADIIETVVRISGDTAQIKRQLGGLENNFKSSFSRIGGIAKNVFGTLGIGLGVGFAVRGITNLVKTTADLGDQIIKAAQATGTTVEAFSTLKFAAEQAGVGQEEFAARLTNLNRRANEAARGVASYRRAFDALGITLTDGQGNLRSTDDLLLDVAAAFSKMEDGSQKAALATDLFSNRGVALIPFLNQGREGIEALQKQARDLGLALDLKTAKSFEEFNDNLNAISKTMAGLKIEIGKELIPVLDDLFRAMAALADIELPDTIGFIERRLEKLGRQSQNIFQSLQRGQFLFPSQMQEQLRLTIEEIDELEQRLRILKERESRPKISAPTIVDERKEKEAGKTGSEIKALNDIQKALFSFNEELERREEFHAEILATVAATEVTDRENAAKQIAQIEKELTSGLLTEKDRRVEIILDEFKEKQKELEDWRLAAIAAGEDVTSVNQRAAEDVAKAWQVAQNDIKNQTEELNQFWIRAMHSMESAVSDFLVDPLNGDFENLADNFKRTIDRMVADLLASQLLDATFGDKFAKGGQLGGVAGSVAGSSFSSIVSSFFPGPGQPGFGLPISSIFGIPFHEGGTIGPFGRIALPRDFTDLGPEERMIRAKVGETIIPAGERVGGDTYVHNWHFNNSDADSFRRSRSQVEGQVMRTASRGRRKN